MPKRSQMVLPEHRGDFCTRAPAIAVGADQFVSDTHDNTTPMRRALMPAASSTAYVRKRSRARPFYRCLRSLPFVSGKSSTPTISVSAAPIKGYQSPE